MSRTGHEGAPPGETFADFRPRAVVDANPVSGVRYGGSQGRCTVFRSFLPRLPRLGLALCLSAAVTDLVAQSGSPRRGPFATRPAIAGTLGVMIPTGQLADRYDWGPAFKGALHLPLFRSVLFVGEFSYARLPLTAPSTDPNFVVRDGRLLGGSTHLLVPLGGSRIPVPGLGRGAPYVIGGVGLFQFDRPTRTESNRLGFTGGVGLSFDAPGHHEAFVEARAMTLALTGQTGVMVPLTVGFRW
ncbi:MAG: hypothetical protein MUF00_11440 [Gemmatimonadaceae bacterium]|jgi:hypothetical protein|nr:hypothetical protein [Gemmatimonadaceae bacterium]